MKEIKIVIKKLNGKMIEQVLSNQEYKVIKKGLKKHDIICWKCQNAYPNKCQKVANVEKKLINEYPFIRSGIQVLEDDFVDKFIVSDCENFEQDDASYKNVNLPKEVQKLWSMAYGIEPGPELNEKRKKGKIKSRAMSAFKR